MLVMNRQSGFTMVEILVALTLSLLLVIGVSQIFIGNRETYKVQNGLALMQENARFAVDTLRRDLSMAGYPQELVAQPINPANTTDTGTAAPDSIGITYQMTTNCAGVAIGDTVATRTYTIAAGALQCNGTPLVDGVENMQFLYGVDTDSDKRKLANMYVTATNVPDWTKVVSVRFALLLNTVEPVDKTKDTAKYHLLDAPEIAPPADSKLRRRIYFGTVGFRNVSQI